MYQRRALVALVLSLALGCSSKTELGSSSKETEQLQNAAQQKADDEEKQETKNRKARNAPPKP